MEKKVSLISGWIGVLIQAIFIFYAVRLLININYSNYEWKDFVIPAILIISFFIMFCGYCVIDPNAALILQFMGKYKGTFKGNGFFLKNPFYGSFIWSLKVSNYAMEPINVTDKNGVPIQIAATIVWKVRNVYKAQYDVANVTQYIDNQFEISIRKLAKEHSYSELSSEDRDFILDLTTKVERAGVEIIDAKITHLAYSPEIASAMLQKQQAAAISEAKEIIVDTAVSIAKEASSHLGFKDPIDQAKFAANLVIVLVSDRGVSPTLNVQAQ